MMRFAHTLPILAACAVSACAGSPPRAVDCAHAHDEHAHATQAPAGGAPAEGARVDPLRIPREAGPGEPREAKVILDNPFMKVLVITLRAGTTLPAHTATVPITIQAIAGAGTVRANGTETRIDREHLVALSPRVPHEVTPDAGTDLVLLVQQMRGAPAQ
jgi:quercetin dioxygenase-like cupin family protein